MTYAEKLKDPRWQKKRLRILDRDKWTCQYCHDKKSELHVHHKKYSGDPWQAKNKDLITLCKDCHKCATLIKIDFECDWVMKFRTEYDVKLFFFKPSNFNRILGVNLYSDGDYEAIILPEELIDKIKQNG